MHHRQRRLLLRRTCRDTHCKSVDSESTWNRTDSYNHRSRSSSGASQSRSTSPQLGDFVLDDEDSALYFAAAASAALPTPKRKAKKSTRKGTSSLFFSASPVSMPVLSARMAKQNPSLQAAAAQLADRLRALSTASESASEREHTLETDETHQQWERALMFASFRRDSRTGTWTPPENAVAGLQRLVAAID